MDDRSITNRELLRVLKAEGRVAWSRFATKALVTAVVVGYLLLNLAKHIKELSDAVSRFSPENGPSQLAVAALAVFGQFVLVTCVLTLLSSLLFSLLQTGFLLSPRALLRFKGVRDLSASFISGVLGLPLGVCVGVWLFRGYLRDVLLLLRQDRDRLVSSMEIIGGKLGNSVIVVALVFAILSGLAARVIFLWRNRAIGRELLRQR